MPRKALRLLRAFSSGTCAARMHCSHSGSRSWRLCEPPSHKEEVCGRFAAGTPLEYNPLCECRKRAETCERPDQIGAFLFREGMMAAIDHNFSRQVVGADQKFAREGLTFDDVALVPGRSSVLPSQVITSTRLTPTI